MGLFNFVHEERRNRPWMPRGKGTPRTRCIVGCTQPKHCKAEDKHRVKEGVVAVHVPKPRKSVPPNSHEVILWTNTKHVAHTSTYLEESTHDAS